MDATSNLGSRDGAWGHAREGRRAVSIIASSPARKAFMAESVRLNHALMQRVVLPYLYLAVKFGQWLRGDLKR